jgi:RNA recognition motif-containing protein
LIFRGLDALTIEENIVTALSKLTAIPVKNIKVLRDELTGTSRGFGFAEFNTLAEGSQMLDLVQSLATPFEVDGKAIIVSYAKNTFSTV